VADHPDGLAGVEEGADELDRGRLRAQLVRVGDTAREDEAVVVVRARLGEDPVGLEGVPLVEVVEGLDRIVRRSDQVGFPPGLADGLGGLDELDLLDPLVGHQKRDSLAAELL
jgi:hypothetical protein